MTHEPTLNEVTLAKECLAHLGEEKSVLHRAAYVLEIVAHSSVGLGEVLQDFAHQAWGQLHEVIRAARNTSSGIYSADDLDVLKNSPMILKTVKTVLEMTPAAMQRNKAETLGEKEKLSRMDVMQVTDTFSSDPNIERLLASEDAGRKLVMLLTPGGGNEAVIAPEHTNVFLETTARH